MEQPIVNTMCLFSNFTQHEISLPDYSSAQLANARSMGTRYGSRAKNAREQHKAILLNFSGSDWCAPCIKMHKEIFNADDFSQWANQHLILVNADFPREKKHQLPKNIQEQNNRLADSYNPKGVFPFTVLIDENGTVLRSWEGYPKTSPPEFIQELSATLSTNTKK